MVEYGPWIFLRISFPYGDKFLTVKSFNPKETAGEYTIPFFHLRAANFKPPIRIGPKDKLNLSKDSQLTSKTGSGDNNDLDKDGSPFQLSNKSDSTFNDGNDEKLPKGLKLTLHRIINHVSQSHLKVGIALIEAQNLVNDDNGKTCLRNTTIHNPLTQDPDPNLEKNDQDDNFQFGNRVSIFNQRKRSIILWSTSQPGSKKSYLRKITCF